MKDTWTRIGVSIQGMLQEYHECRDRTTIMSHGSRADCYEVDFMTYVARRVQDRPTTVKCSGMRNKCST